MPGPNVPFPPMEAELVEELPEGGGWQYEPKWDGFRGVLENDGGELALWSRNGRPLLRYFPELAALGDELPPHSALDGEIVIEKDGGLDFDSLQMRLHPAESRIRMLSGQIPARFVAFDLLLWDDEPVHRLPLEERRRALEERAAGFARSPCSPDAADARDWLARLEGAGFDGVVAKRLGLPYLPGSRDGVVKVKRHRSVDCVVVGVRWKEGSDEIATLLLGLYDDGELRYVGTAAAGGRKREVEEYVRPLLGPSPERAVQRDPSRWRAGKELEQSRVEPRVVVEVRYDKWEQDRFRHGTRLLRFRLDKEPGACTVDQVKPRRRPDDPTVAELLGRGARTAAGG